jgi:glycosyltransferase involved in cell wall biosynthesis
MAKPPKLVSLCMIVKDEEEQLPRCLNSVQNVVDEIIVVDTGSKDRTAAIAETYGAKVIYTNWEGDFAKARNLGLEQASGEWILFLDADEELDGATRNGLRKMAQETDAGGLFLQIWNVLGTERRGGTVHPVLRMFRRDPDIRFEGRIHEQIAASVLRKWPNAVFRLTDAKIIHYGYKPDQVAGKNKLKRNMELLEQTIREEPDNAFHRYNIGVEYLRVGAAKQALEAFRVARRQPGFAELSYAHLIIKYEVRSLLALGLAEEAAQTAAAGAAMYPDYADLYHYEAVALAEAGRLHAAARLAERTLELGVAPAQYHTEDGIGAYRTAYLLGRLNEALLDTQGVAGAYVLALSHYSGFVPPLYRLCHYMRKTGQEQRLSALLAERLVCPTVEASEKVAHILLATGCDVAAKQWLSRYEAQGAEVAELANRRERLEKEAAEIERATASPFAEMCSRADQHLEGLQQFLGAYKVKTVGLSADALAVLRLRLPCKEGWEMQ